MDFIEESRDLQVLEDAIRYFVNTNVQQNEHQHPRKKRITVPRDREAAHDSLVADYFSDQPMYNEDNSDHPNAAMRLGASAVQKCTAAIRMLAYGCEADQVDEYLKLGASTSRECITKFVDGVIAHFSIDYLRKPTPEDVQRLLREGEERGFPGMLGSMDCMRWVWKNCPAGWKGMYQGRSKTATVILEAIASRDLWIWHAFFGTPGSCNDINVLQRSPVFDDIINNRAPQVQFTVNGNTYKKGYYLTDGIYPKWSTFVDTITAPQTYKQRLFTKRQESARKDVERAFGVLQARFAIIRKPALAWNVDML
ncbi:uncharacterized protein [Spinacia oleracea]|uniref:DDE Tnp4 domain-containing protein n=1 Tax=Spinacia oleracea TaxID=3562 RepID=A0ABM3RJK7_SPIOL|nr:uncharacterized protein LOC110779288 [Spinacia oleracea]